MTTASPTRVRASRRRRAFASAVVMLAAQAAVAQPSGVAAQPSNSPIVEVICQVNGGVARTVRVTYPAMAVTNLHVFTPLSGGANLVIHPSSRTQVYTFAVPAGSYRLKYAARMTSGGYPPVLSAYAPVIVIPPFRVAGRLCERGQIAGGPSS